MFLFFFSLSNAENLPPKNVAFFEAGNFIRGSDRSTDESPRHSISLSAFYMDKYEVSIAEFEDFVQI